MAVRARKTWSRWALSSDGGRLMPSTPRGWLNWSAYVLDAQARPFSQRYDGMPRTDPRLRDSRETALSVKILAEQASAKCTGNGVGVALLRRYYLEGACLEDFTEAEKTAFTKTAAELSRRLIKAGFIEKKVRIG